jgi:diguanylate cyclase (GGDEF)-like protein
MSVQRIYVISAISAGAGLLFVGWMTGVWGGESVTRAVGEMGLLCFPLYAAVCASVAARRGCGRRRAAWICLAAGLGCWALGEAISIYFLLWQGQDQAPFPSLADAAFLLFPVWAGAALARFPVGQTGHSRAGHVLDGLIIAISLFVVSWVSELDGRYRTGATSGFALAVSLAYPVADVVLITMALLVMARAITAQRVTLGLVTAGIVLIALSDSAFAYLTARGVYNPGRLFDVGWVAGFLVLGSAALVSTRAPRADPESLQVPAQVRLWLPFLPLLVAGLVGATQVLPSVLSRPVTGAALILGTVVLAGQFLVLAENRRLLATVDDQALRDPLTGLANRALFLDRLTHAVALRHREPRSIAVLSLDLDDFKRVNDDLGHRASDALLIHIAERLLDCTRAGDTVARLGGDEFSILVEDGPDHPLQVAHRVVKAFDAPFLVDGYSITVHPSVGLAVGSAADIEVSADTLLKRADIAMYSAKRAGTGLLRTFTQDMHVADHTDLNDFKLRPNPARAPDDPRLQIVEQPLVNAASGAEDLSRRNDREDGPDPTFAPRPNNRAARAEQPANTTTPVGWPVQPGERDRPRRLTLPVAGGLHRGRSVVAAGVESLRARWSAGRGPQAWDNRPNQAHRVVQVAMLAVIIGFLVTTLPGVRATPGFSWWMDGILENAALGAAAGLCLVRIPASSPDRVAWRILALGLTFYGLANTYFIWFVTPLDPMPYPTLSDGMWVLGFYPCLFVALLLLVRSRVDRFPLSLAIDSVLVGLGAATVAASLVVPVLVTVLRGRVAAVATNLIFPILDLLLLALILAAMALFRWRPPPALWWVAGGLAVSAVVDSIYLIQVADESYQPGGYIDASWVIAAMLIAFAPGWHRRPAIARVPPTWLPLAAPLLATAAALSVLWFDDYPPITPARYLAAAAILAALGRLAVAFREAHRAADHARQAHTDDLTSLLNRRGFYDRAATLLPGTNRGRSGKQTCALLLLDLDHFKDVNDSLGHAAGDELLRVVAARLTIPLREEDILVRLGGDEFALLLPQAHADHALRAAAALLTTLDATVELDGLHVKTGASIGIALSPEHGRDIGTLLRHADIAMYEAKRTHTGHLVYTPDAAGHETTRAGMQLLGQLRRAIDHGELSVHYQPKVSLRTGDIVGVEALVRWRHPDRGLLYPDQFLPLVRQNGLMDALTELVLERALDDAASWHAGGHVLPVAVNLFPPALADLDLPDRMANALDRRDLPSAALTVEITEDFLVGNLGRARTVLHGLRSLGIRIAIDDFGSGYSALSYLRELPIDEVKLDRSFIAPITEHPHTAAIVRAVIDLAHTLGLTTVAEGVETAAIAATLTSYRCDVAQGHYYSPPMSTPELLHLLAPPIRAPDPR